MFVLVYSQNRAINIVLSCVFLLALLQTVARCKAFRKRHVRTGRVRQRYGLTRRCSRHCLLRSVRAERQQRARCHQLPDACARAVLARELARSVCTRACLTLASVKNRVFDRRFRARVGCIVQYVGHVLHHRVQASDRFQQTRHTRAATTTHPQQRIAAHQRPHARHRPSVAAARRRGLSGQHNDSRAGANHSSHVGGGSCGAFMVRRQPEHSGDGDAVTARGRGRTALGSQLHATG